MKSKSGNDYEVSDIASGTHMKGFLNISSHSLNFVVVESHHGGRISKKWVEYDILKYL